MTNEALLKIVKSGLSGDIEPITALFKLQEELTANIRGEIAKKSGVKSSDITIIKRITKEAKQNPMYEKAHEFIFEGKKYYGFLEGHYVLASENTFEYEIAEPENTFKLQEFFKSDLFEQTKVLINMETLKFICKTTKKSEATLNPYIIEVGDIKIGLNPFYLLDALQFNNTDEVIVNQHDSVAPVVLRNDNRNTLALILPIRLKK